MRDVMHVDQLAKVGVDRDQDSPRRFRKLQKGAVPRVRPQGTSFDDVMPVIAKPLCQAAPGASIDQEPHDSPTETVASVSRAMTACA